MTLILGSLAEGATRHGHLTVHHTHGGVQRAQEHPQVRAALQVNQGMKRLKEWAEENSYYTHHVEQKYQLFTCVACFRNFVAVKSFRARVCIYQWCGAQCQAWTVMTSSQNIAGSHQVPKIRTKKNHTLECGIYNQTSSST